MPPTDPPAAADLSFLAPPDAVSDWRRVVLFDVASRSGMLAALPATAADVAAQLDLAEEVTAAVLQALTAWGLVRIGTDGRCERGPAVFGGEDGAVLRHHAAALRQWASALEPRLHREEPPAAATQPVAAEDFHDALARLARRAAPAVVDVVLGHFPEARTALDLGGLHGEYGLELARRGVHVTMQDVPRMVDVARERGRLADAGVELFAGDFFEDLPDRVFDVVVLTGVTHTYGRGANVRLYQRLRSVLRAGGGLVIGTRLGRPEDAVGHLFAVQMALGGRGGNTHSADDYRAWLGEAGYAVVEVAHDTAERQGLVVATRG